MEKPDISPQHSRENVEPDEVANPIPWFILILTALLIAFSIVYIARSSLSNPSTYGDGREIAELQGAEPAAGGAQVDGAAVFGARCAACHQANGAGLPGVFPPLAGSEWVIGKETTLVAILLHGVSGPLTVKGASFNGVMPAFGDQINDAEIAAVATYIRTQWGNTADAVSTATVTEARASGASRTEPYKGDSELSSLK